MQNFQINERVNVECHTNSTKSGFSHIAKLFINGKQVKKVSCQYLNRTWERYQYESVLKKLANKATKILSGSDFEDLVKAINR